MDERARLRRGLLWLVGLRAATVAAVIGAAVLAEVREAPAAAVVDPFFALMGATCALTAVSAALLRAAVARPWLVDAQLATDVVLVAVLVSLTGGLKSDFAPLFVLPVVAGGALRLRRGGVLISSLAAASLAFLAALQTAGPAGASAWAEVFAGVPRPAPGEAAFTVGVNGLGFLAVGWLTGYLAEAARRSGSALERATSRLATLEAYNQHVIDSLTGGLLTTDADGRVLTFNRAATAITGLAADDALGRRVWHVLQLPDGFTNALDRILEPGRGHRFELRFVRPDRTAIDVGLSAAPLAMPTGRSGYLFTFQDLTELKRLEREAELQKRLAAVGEMAAGIAHEIRNPLASMAGSIQVLRGELALTSEQAQLLDIVLRESARLNETISNFLAYARPQRREAAPVDVGQIIEEAAALLRNSPECRPDHRLVVDRAPSAWTEANDAQLRQVVWNLATNALRAMPSGGALRLSTALVDLERPQVVLTVTDEGTGMAPEVLDRLFHPFQSGFRGGTGLGLAIVHRIVTEYGGELSVESERGHGTAVRVVLPAVAAPAATGAGAGALDHAQVA